MSKPVLAIFISGRGSNMVSLVEAVNKGQVTASIAVVISNQTNVQGIQKARDLGVPCEVICRSDYATKVDYEQALFTVLTKYQVEWIALAGYMMLIGPTLLTKYPNRIVNIHPSLLPAFKGLDAQKQAIDYGVKFSGCTVHYVNEEMDGGEVIDQVVVSVDKADTVETLSHKILQEEHQLYPRALESVLIDQRKEK